jgi:DNA-binding NarL/FixJ family response regulator
MEDFIVPHVSESQHWPGITRQEMEVLKLLAQGMTNRQIADDLDISVQTVKNHTTSIYKKLKVQNRTQAVLVARQMGIVLF